MFLFLLGIFFKYDMSSIMVRVESRHRSFWGFLVRLCGIVGGMFATSGKILKSFFTHVGSLWATMPCFKILLKVLYSCGLQYYFLIYYLLNVCCRDATFIYWLLVWCGNLPVSVEEKGWKSEFCYYSPSGVICCFRIIIDSIQYQIASNLFCLNVYLIVTIFLEKPFNITCCYSYLLSAPYNVRGLSRNICDPTKWLAFSTNPTRPRSCCQFLPRGSQPRGEHCFTRQCDSWRSITSDNIIQIAFNSLIIFVYASLRMVWHDICNKLTSFLCLRILILYSQSSSHK